MNNNLDSRKYSEVIGALETSEKRNGLISGISKTIKKQLFQILGAAGFIAMMTGAPGKAKAAISDCGDTTSCLASVNTSNQAEFLNLNGNVEGIINTNVGPGLSTENGHITVTGSGGAKIINVATEGTCIAATGTSAGSTMMNGIVYIAKGSQVETFDTSCASQGSFPSGQAVSQLTNNGISKVYGVDQMNGDIITHDASTLNTTTNPTGLEFADQTAGLTITNGDLQLTTSGGIETTTLPSYTASLLVSLPERTNKVINNGTHLAAKAASGNTTYIIRLSDNNVTTINFHTNGLAFSGNNTIYLGGNNGIAEYDLDGSFVRQISANASEGLAFLPAQNPVTDICDGVEITGSEVCDGTLLAGQDCASQGFDTGTLACASDCATFDTSGCANATCGDGTTNGTETCDGTDLNGNDCTTIIGQDFIAGTLACNSGCDSYDTTSCVTQECGDGNIDGTEACDGTNVNNETCITLGYASGDLTCKDSCAEFDETGCEDAPDPVCGNDITEAGEDCDDGNIIDGDGCSATCTTEVEVCEFTDDTELTIETAEDTQQVDTSQLVGIISNLYNANLANLERDCTIECTTDDLTGDPRMRITASNGNYCNFKLVTGEKGEARYNEQIYQLFDIDTTDGESAVLGFSIEDSSRSKLESGGLILVHSGRQIKTNIVSALGGGTLGTTVVYELHAEYEGVKAKWVKLTIGDGGIRFYHPETPDEYRDVYFDDDTEGAEPVVIWLNLTEFNKSRNLDESLFPTDIRDPKNPNWWGCSTSGDQSPEGSTGMLALSMFIATGLAAWRKKKKNGEIVDEDVDENDNEVSE